jgi:hypothetical protein
MTVTSNLTKLKSSNIWETLSTNHETLLLSYDIIFLKKSLNGQNTFKTPSTLIQLSLDELELKKTWGMSHDMTAFRALKRIVDLAMMIFEDFPGTRYFQLFTWVNTEASDEFAPVVDLYREI